MAVVRARSAPPYGAIAFATLWVISTAVAIFALVNYGSVGEKLATLQKQTDAARKEQAANQQLVNDLKTAIAGNANFDAAGLKGLIENSLRQAKRAGTEPLATALTAVAREREDKTRQLDELTGRLTGLDKEIASRGTSTKESVDKLRADNENLQKQLIAANDAAAKANADRDAAVQKGQEAINTQTQQAEQARRENVLAVEQLKTENQGLVEQVNQLRALVKSIKGEGDKMTTGEPDGRIVSISPTTAEVYINLSKKDRVVPGLTFTIYDARSGVRYGTDELALGKGAIEVIQVGENTSLARITRTTKGQAIQTGDIIANLAYHNDKNRKTRFAIVGDFDLDGDGVATPGERERLVNLISSWGGQIDDAVTTQTDFVVAGVRPTTSAVNAEDTAAGGANDARKNAQTHYDEVVAEAKRLTIPVLNSNRFLNLIGYYNTTMVR